MGLVGAADGGELAGEGGQGPGVAGQDPVGRLRRGQAGVEGVEQSLGRQGVEGQGGVAGGDPAIADRRLQPGAMGGAIAAAGLVPAVGGQQRPEHRQRRARSTRLAGGRPTRAADRSASVWKASEAAAVRQWRGVPPAIGLGLDLGHTWRQAGARPARAQPQTSRSPTVRRAPCAGQQPRAAAAASMTSGGGDLDTLPRPVELDAPAAARRARQRSAGPAPAAVAPRAAAIARRRRSKRSAVKVPAVTVGIGEGVPLDRLCHRPSRRDGHGMARDRRRGTLPTAPCRSATGGPRPAATRRRAARRSAWRSISSTSPERSQVERGDCAGRARPDDQDIDCQSRPPAI